MKMLLLHMPTPTGSDKQVAVNADEILRMEEVEGGTTQIIQQDKGPTTVKENLEDILKALGGEVKEVKSEKKQTGQQQQPQPSGQQAGVGTAQNQPQPSPPLRHDQPIAQHKAGGR